MPTDEPNSSASAAGNRQSWNDWLRVAIPICVISIAAFALAWHFVKPAPPKHVVIATGSKQGVYYATALKYADYFSDNGVTLDVRETAGSAENFKLLNDPESGVDIAVVQGGSSPPPDQRKHIQAVAGIYYEPVLVFYRGGTPLTQLSQLTGKTIAIGAAGSGVRIMAQMLLSEAGINGSADGSSLVDLGGDKAADALISKQIDAAFYVMAPTAPVIARLLASPDVHLMSFDHAHAYGRLHPFLSATTLYQGAVDIKQNLPPTDVQVIAAPATLVIRDSTHEAITELLVRAAQENNSGTTLLSPAGTFPNAEGSELPVNRDAKYFLKNPPSILHRTLPFWLASMVDRLIIMVLPLLVVLIPLVRMAPPLLKYRTQRKILSRYKRCRQIEEKLSSSSPHAALRTGLDELLAMDHELATLKIPISFAQDLYNLRINVGYVRTRLERWLEASAVRAS
jgi:TRAP transporter TAXI family solute receptor